MNTGARRTALIVGAGIGGLAAALALQRAGWNTRVFEKATSARELGFALLLAPNAMQALRALGIADAVAGGGVVADSGEIRRADGKVLRRMNVTRVAAALGAPTVCVLRPVLHGLLFEAVGQDTIELASHAVSLSDAGDGVSLMLGGGRTVHGNVLIGADGVASTMRRILHPGEPPAQSSGLFALRGVALGVGDRLGRLSGIQYFGRGVEAGVARASDRALYWYLSIPAREIARRGRDPLDLAHQLAADFDDTFRSIVAATTREDLRLDELLEREPLRQWGSGRVTLLGDAAHPMLPHAGQGAAQALEDAVALARALEAPGREVTSLRAYERARAPRRTLIAQIARRNARMSAIDSGIGCWFRDLAIQLVPEAVIARSLLAAAGK